MGSATKREASSSPASSAAGAPAEFAPGANMAPWHSHRSASRSISDQALGFIVILVAWWWVARPARACPASVTERGCPALLPGADSVA